MKQKAASAEARGLHRVQTGLLYTGRVNASVMCLQQQTLSRFIQISQS